VPEGRDVSLRSTGHAAHNMHANEIKRLLRIFELSKNEQRVVLVVISVLIAIAFVGYERRVHRSSLQPTSATKPKTSPSPLEIRDE
jgi:hypothetical protein